MNWYKKANSKIFVGDCITGLEDPNFQDILGVYDATDLAQLVANGTEISFNQFLNIVGKNCDIEGIRGDQKNYEFYFSPEKNIVWIYNIRKDIEYFYK